MLHIQTNGFANGACINYVGTEITIKNNIIIIYV